MVTVWIRVYEELNDYLPAKDRKRAFARTLPAGAVIADLLADLGIPASQVDLVLAGGVSVGLSYPIGDNENVSVYPVFEALDVAGIAKVRSQPLRETRFISDPSLLPLARHLRLLGFDVEIAEGALIDADLLQRAEAERRILLTRSGGHSEPVAMSRVLAVTKAAPGEQLREVLSRLDLFRAASRHAWDVTPGEAYGIQERLRREVVPRDELGDVRWIGGVDVAYRESDGVARAAVALLSFPDLVLCESAVATLPLRFPYVPGFLSFRETPPVLQAIGRLRQLPDLLFCDGHGIAHPRRFGMACHVGVLSGIPSIGVAKTPLIGSHAELPRERGAWIPLVDQGETIGAVVCTARDVKPVYVSVGNGISLETAVGFVLRCSRHRLPEPSRWADRLSRRWTRKQAPDD